jgi:hypothetical protein
MVWFRQKHDMTKYGDRIYSVMFGFLKATKGELLSQAYPQVNLQMEKYQTNNQYSKFPPLTEDGRNVLASWQPEAVVNESILRQNHIQSNWQYRKYMTSNANDIRGQMFHDALHDVGYTVRNENPAIDRASFDGPKLYGSILEPVSHKEAKLSDLKENYLSREQLQSRMIVPELTQDQLIQLKGQSA